MVKSKKRWSKQKRNLASMVRFYESLYERNGSEYFKEKVNYYKREFETIED